LFLQDLDDALHIKPIGGGRFEVGVHIADVSHFVRPGKPVDDEARVRCTSTYLVTRVIPMLPPILCEQLCSLNPDVDRLAFSCIWVMNSEGEMEPDEVRAP
jgi:exoribonuclease R